jgi:hypothetical protein
MSYPSKRFLALLLPFWGCVCLVIIGTSGCAPDDKDKEPEPKPPLEWLTQGTWLETGPLSQQVQLEDNLRASSITLEPGEGKGKFILVVDPNRRRFNLFGDAMPVTELAKRRIPVTLKPLKIADPLNLGRVLYEVEEEKIRGRLILVVPAKPDGQLQLVVRDKAGNADVVCPLQKQRERLLEPCHPGCFPAGTLVETPAGPRRIETIRPGDEVLNVTAAGKTESAKVASVFAGQSLLMEIETEHGKLVTTAKQPLRLCDGGVTASMDLKAGDEIVLWQDGQAKAVKVRGVRALEQPAKVFNLVLEVRGTFIANGYLVRSKPPVDQ